MVSSKEVGTRWFHEVWKRRNLDAIEELMAPGALGHLEGGQEIAGPKEFREFFEAIVSALPDIQVEVLKVIAEGEHVSVLWSAKAVHSGDGLGLKATGRPVAFRGITWLHVVSGKIVEGWDCWNQGGLIGALTLPEPENPALYVGD